RRAAAHGAGILRRPAGRPGPGRPRDGLSPPAFYGYRRAVGGTGCGGNHTAMPCVGGDLDRHAGAAGGTAFPVGFRPFASQKRPPIAASPWPLRRRPTTLAVSRFSTF